MTANANEVSAKLGTPDQPADVLALLRAQGELYRQLGRCAERQRGLIEQDDATPLLQILADRQRLTRALAVVGDALRPVRDTWASWRDRFDPVQQAEADKLVDEAKARLAAIIAQDDKDCQLLCAKKDATAQAMQSTRHGASAVGAYRNAPSPVAPRNHLDEAS